MLETADKKFENDEEDEDFVQDGDKPPEKVEPPYGTVEWLYFWADVDGELPTPINVSITEATAYECQKLIWYNADVVPHKIKVTNTGCSVNIGLKWKTERPYLEGGIFLEKHIFSQIHFHWGPNMTEGSDHTVDDRKYPGEMQVSFFRSEYMTQNEALQYPDGVVMVCYIIKYGVVRDARMQRMIEAFPRIVEANTSTRIGPYCLYDLIPLFYEDYFLYWGFLESEEKRYIVRWLVPRITISASFEQMAEFRTLCNNMNKPILKNNRPLQEREDRHLWLINPHWNLYNSTLPIPRVLEPSISKLSRSYNINPINK